MAIIDPDGMFNGTRLCRCSKMARLYWPYLFLASNGCARLELDYNRIVATAFANFPEAPTKEEVQGYLKEYAANHLLFAYEADGRIWGQWDCPTRLLSKYKTKSDLRSPSPPEKEYQEWLSSYRSETNGFREILKTSGNLGTNLPLGIGIGVGIGEIHMSETSVPDNTPAKPDYDGEAIRWVFDYYVQTLDRNPQTYKFSDKRQKMLRSFLREQKPVRGSGKAAVNFMGRMVDAITRSDWHMGRDPRTHGKTYNEIENIFAPSKCQQWITVVEREEGEQVDEQYQTANSYHA